MLSDLYFALRLFSGPDWLSDEDRTLAVSLSQWFAPNSLCHVISGCLQLIHNSFQLYLPVTGGSVYSTSTAEATATHLYLKKAFISIPLFDMRSWSN